jgi:predicted nucleic acid-binding Zn ribbon protein
VAIPSFPPLGRAAGQLQRLGLTVLPSGGQRTARRNAWSALAADAATAQARREAELALQAAARGTGRTAVGGRWATH